MIENLSFCVYIGNTSTIDDEILMEYCSQYGRMRLCPMKSRLFRDFHLVEFDNIDELNLFLQISNHRINSIDLEVKLYRNLLDQHEILSLDRKIYLEPVEDLNQLNSAIESYKSIDQNLISNLIQNRYLLIEFTNNEYRQKIFNENPFHHRLHLPMDPKDLQSNSKIYIHGLNEQITKNILLDYFEKRTTIVSYEIGSNYAIIEFEDKKFAEELLRTLILSLNGTDLRVSRLAERKQLIRSMKNESQQIEIENHRYKLEKLTRENHLENQIIQLRNEYENKFRHDRLLIEQEFQRLIADQRRKFDRFQQSKYSRQRKHY